MAKKQWNINVADKLHIVEVEWSRWSNAGELKVDGNTVKVWGSGWWVPREADFEVEGTKAFLKRKGMFAEDFDLYVGGRKY